MATSMESDGKGRPQGPPVAGNGGGAGLKWIDYLPVPTAPDVKNVLSIDPPRGLVDPLARTIIGHRAAALEEARKDQSRSLIDAVLAAIEQRLTDAVAQLTAELNKASLDEASRLVLSTTTIYAHVLLRLIEAGFDLTDVSGAKERILRELPSKHHGEKAIFLREVTEAVLRRRDIHLPEALKEFVVRQVWASPPPLSSGGLQAAILAIYDGTVQAGNVPAYVGWYLSQQAIPRATITPTIRQGMVDYLLDLDLPYGTKEFEADLLAHKYDQFFALAFDSARARSNGQNDPMDAMRTVGAVASWDYSVDLFDGVEEQGVVRDNILAAGALDYVYWIGDFMGVLKIAKALVLRWGSGLLDLSDPAAISMLYRYYKLLDQRASDEERGMLYKRILARGDVQLTSQMVVNSSFPTLWHGLMGEVAEYIRKSEETRGGVEQVSPTPVYQAARDLQYNLSDHMTGLAVIQVQEIYAQLQEAIAILRNPDVIDQFGLGRRKNLWTVIERIAKEQFGTALNVASIRTLAVEGNRVFRWLADFDGNAALRAAIDFSAAPADTKTLNALLQPAEAWIIAQADVDGMLAGGSPDGAAAPPDEVPRATPPASGQRQGEDEFADWNV